MINLNAVANNIVTAINPNVPALIQFSDGYTVDDAGNSKPRYIVPPTSMMVQVQQLTQRQLQHMLELNIQGVMVNIYLDGRLSGLVRRDRKGGDLVTVQAGVSKGLYLTTDVAEQWGPWVKVVCTLQNDKAQPSNC